MDPILWMWRALRTIDWFTIYFSISPFPLTPSFVSKVNSIFFFQSRVSFLKSHLLQGHFQYRNSIKGKAAYTKIPRSLCSKKQSNVPIIFVNSFCRDCLVLVLLFILTMEISNFIIAIGFYFRKSDTTEPQKAWLHFSKIKCFNQS